MAIDDFAYWGRSLLYDEAMLFSATRLKIQDSELKEGHVETMSMETKVGVVTRPWCIEGGFAVVYKFRTRSGRLRALRCFRVPMRTDIQFRYERIGAYFADHIPHISVDFKYHEQGILVKEIVLGSQQNKIYPVIEMDWIEGKTLLDAVDALCKKRERAGLLKLANQWLALFMTLQRSHIAHGDLSGVDVLVRTDGQLILIDYDGAYIPDFSHLPPLLLGKEDYQHPQMGQRKFNKQMDDFSALVIYTALQALTIRPELWDKYTHRNSHGELLDITILFNQRDYRDPDQSALMHELQSINDRRLQLAVQELKKACQQPIDQVRFPFHIINPKHDKKVEIFFCYAREDQIFLNDLKMHLMPLERQGLIKVWHDADISSGMKWEEEIRKRLNTADVILLLVSPHFMASDYSYSKEMMHAMERHERGDARVIPVILRPVYWHSALFGNIQALPTDALPITRWQDRDDALFNVAEGIRKAVEELIPTSF